MKEGELVDVPDVQKAKLGKGGRGAAVVQVVWLPVQRNNVAAKDALAASAITGVSIMSAYNRFLADPL